MPHAHHAGLVVRNAPVRREVIPSDRLPLLVPTTTATTGAGFPSLVVRAPASTESSSGEKPTSNLYTTVLPVVLGAGVPIVCAIVVLIFLHRRHVKKLMREDANDKHKSLDFGMDVVGPPSGRPRKNLNGMPQMMEPSHAKGMSLDINDDKYRPANFVGHDAASIRSYPRSRDDGASLAGSTRYGAAEEPNAGLLRNAQRMSRSSPPLYKTSNELNGRSPDGYNQPHFEPVSSLTPAPAEHDEHEHGLAIDSATTDQNKNTRQGPLSPEPQFHLNSTSELHFETEPHQYGTHGTIQANTHEDRPNFPLPDPLPLSHPEPVHTPNATMQLPRISLPASDVTSDYGDERRSAQMIPPVNVHSADEIPHQHEQKLPELAEESQNLEPVYDTRRDTRRLTLGVRPLPPEDPADNPEQRANRIRSFYKEYFDESKRETTYYEDYGPEIYDGGYVYDPTTAHCSSGYDSSPLGLPPRFQGAARHMATNSAGFNGYNPGPRAFSSASGRLPGPRGPRKPMPPPSPLQILPTPHMLKDDSIFTAADFAPGKSFRDQREGRPETPTGGMRPYSPAIRAHTPLASAFDELAVIPSPHALRKSGTYTSLDFMPPPRFKNSDGGSDAGSIRSNRTGISNTHMNNIRMGNYRVSRLAADMVGTKDDMVTSLRPDWDMKR
ncbi:hypothetical protein N7462_006379 [Penicillium macrosclerotiorum]|uniref:uncharacterized protein n=1 Tax=Penicillium macrosclerotiorum TaxID=303699 RepID=UPI0025482792|nr:uncharacterized protein N7462_006379 [Penicillium macrosclerotiorum]KAJ5683214.1 hypothetical protein N7462_006379 [Penicillium macrosclerotiorum]